MLIQLEGWVLEQRLGRPPNDDEWREITERIFNATLKAETALTLNYANHCEAQRRTASVISDIKLAFVVGVVALVVALILL